MANPIDRATVIGDGAMGTLCALMLADRGMAVSLWGVSNDHVAVLNRDRENKRYLPGFPFPNILTVTNDDAAALKDAALVISAVPCQYMRTVWTQLAPWVDQKTPIVSVAKGVELKTLACPTTIIQQCVGQVPVACLSGPSIAREVAQHKPASLVAASMDLNVAQLVQVSFSNEYFRVYTSQDLIGVEIAGAVKNVIAIAAGICDGIDCGDNAKASLLTRGLVEITRLGLAMGAVVETFRGLAGVGDLFTTCVSKIGRNRSAGQRIGQGETAEQVVRSTKSVIEGIPTTKSVLTLAQQYNVEMPIVESVASVLFDDVKPATAIRSLMTRQLRQETDY